MNLLFDHNLSPHLVARLADVFPVSNHVFSLDLHQKDDLEIWQYALLHEFTQVTKDADFSDLSTLFGFPPKVIWIKRGNCSTQDIEAIIRENAESIASLEWDEAVGIITLF